MHESKTSKSKMVDPGATEVPYLQITVNTDPLHTDLQLQQALRLNASRESLSSFHSAQSAAQSPQTRSPQDTTTPKNRKHARSLSYTSDLSEISGRFDDADEVDALSGDVLGGGAGTGAGEDGIMARAMMEYGHYSPVHSAKRNRGNEWSYTQSPLRAELSHDHVQDQDQGHAQNQDDDKRESFSRRWRIGRRGASHGSMLSSPRTTSSPRAAASPRAMATGGGGAGGAGAGAGRRSRFVENMNDGVSEKPPSIFLRERGEGKAGHGRSIFRFGRAIASAFNPFGWGGSTGSTGSTGGGGPGGSSAEERRQQQLQLQQQQDISRVQMAYEELKKSGYKGVVQHYPAQRVHPAQHPQHAPEHDIQDRSSASGAAPAQGTKTEPGQERTRTSLQLRRTKSTSKDQDPEDRKSRKDLIRQEKLLKKVSTLEDKLERARRELRDLGGEAVEPAEVGDVEPEEDVSVPVQTGYMASTEYYPRRFVPGALPTLPSERCLEEQAGEDDAEGAGATAEEGPLQSLSPNVIRHAPKDEKLDTPKSKEKSNTLKRKSPDPSALEALELNVETTPTPTPTNSRKTKLQKKGKSDSPGSVDRMQDSNSNSNSNNNTPKRTNSGRRRQYTSPQSSPSARRRPSPSLTRHDSRMDIDGETTDTDTDTKDLLMLSSSATDISQQHNQQLQLQNQDRSSFYLQDQHAINEDHEQGLSPSPSVSTRRSNSNRSRREYIPPVPPLPKDLAATAAKVDKRLAKELARRQSSLTMNQ